MSFTFAATFWLWALAPVLTFALVAAWLSRRHSRRWRRVCIFAPTMAALLLTLGLSQPAAIYSPEARDIVILLDQSPSTRTSPWNDPAWVRALLVQHLGNNGTGRSGIRVTVLGFATRVRVLAQDIPIADASRWPSTWPESAGTEGSGDLRAALLWLDPRPFLDRHPRWLITDGFLDFTPLDEIRTRYALAVTIIPPTQVDVGVADIEVRPAATQPAANAPLELWARLQATGPARITVQVLRDGQLLAERPASFSGPSSRSISVVDPRAGAAYGSTRYEVRIAGNDPWPEDNSAAILVPAPGPPTVLIVTSHPETFRAPWTPEPASGYLRVVSPDNMPIDLAAVESATRQVIVLDNIPRDQLRPGAEDYLDHWVKDLGGGLLLTGSTHAFGPGGYAHTLLDDLSPLASTPPKRPPYRIIFLLDASGSMGELGPRGGKKFAYAAEATQDALPSLKPDDELVVLTFNAALREIARGAKDQISPTLHDLLEKVAPNGPTNPDSALETLERDIGTDGQRTLLILLTDGEIPKMDVARWTKLVKDSGTKLALIAPAAKSSQETLARLAAAIEPAHVAWLPTEKPEDWSALMKRAVDEQVVGKARTNPLLWQFATASPADTMPDNSSGTPGGETHAWIETWAKPGITLRAIGGDSNSPTPLPLAAIWQRGLGKVAAVNFTPFATAIRFPPLMRQLISEIAPQPGDRRFTITVDRDAPPPNTGRWRIRAQGLTDKGFLDGESLRLHIFPADAPALDIPMDQIGPGRYEALLPPDIGLFSGIIVRNSTVAPSQEELVARLNPPHLPGREWPATAIPASSPPWAQRLDAADSAASVIPWQPRQFESRWEMTPWLWPVAAAILVAALWARRGK